MIFTEKDLRALENIRCVIRETLLTVRQMGSDLDPELVAGITSYLRDLDGDVETEIAQFDSTYLPDLTVDEDPVEILDVF